MEANLNNDKNAGSEKGPVKQEKKVKIEAIRPCRIGKDEADNDIMLEPGQTALVTEAVAKEYCDKSFPTQWPFSGERDAAEAEATRNEKKIFRAKRVP